MSKLKEPDWSYSHTLSSEMWKSPLYSMDTRLLMADTAVAQRDATIKQLQKQMQVYRAAKMGLDEESVKYAIYMDDGRIIVELVKTDVVMLELKNQHGAAQAIFHSVANNWGKAFDK